jgi:hypothetical protein
MEAGLDALAEMLINHFAHTDVPAPGQGMRDNGKLKPSGCSDLAASSFPRSNEFFAWKRIPVKGR